MASARLSISNVNHILNDLRCFYSLLDLPRILTIVARLLANQCWIGFLAKVFKKVLSTTTRRDAIVHHSLQRVEGPFHRFLFALWILARAVLLLNKIGELRRFVFGVVQHADGRFSIATSTTRFLVEPVYCFCQGPVHHVSNVSQIDAMLKTVTLRGVSNDKLASLNAIHTSTFKHGGESAASPKRAPMPCPGSNQPTKLTPYQS